MAWYVFCRKVENAKIRIGIGSIIGVTIASRLVRIALIGIVCFIDAKGLDFSFTC